MEYILTNNIKLDLLNIEILRTNHFYLNMFFDYESHNNRRSVYDLLNFFSKYCLFFNTIREEERNVLYIPDE